MLYLLKRTTESGRRVRIGGTASLSEAKAALSQLPPHVIDDVGIYHAATGRCLVDGITLRENNSNARREAEHCQSADLFAEQGKVSPAGVQRR